MGSTGSVLSESSHGKPGSPNTIVKSVSGRDFDGSSKRSVRMATELYQRMPAAEALLHVISVETGKNAFMKFLSDNFTVENLWFYMVS